MQITSGSSYYEPVLLGIDLGTAGVRVLAVSGKGEVLSVGEAAYPQESIRVDGGNHEQDPEAWWQAVLSAVRGLVQRLEKHTPTTAIRALAVDGTSGTLVCVNEEGEAVRWAIMYDDSRAETQAAALARHADDVGPSIAGSFAIPKMLWLIRNDPETVAEVALFTSQADYIAARLGAEFGVSDYSNSLKSGYDLVHERWPAWLDEYSGIRDRLPRVVEPGTQIGVLLPEVGNQLGLPGDIPIHSGATDGVAAFLASGATRSGDYNTTLGTTLVFKAMSDRFSIADDGLVYSHKLPGGFWLPGAASNTGGNCLSEYDQEDLANLDLMAERELPCEHLAYPLVKTGERFPFAVRKATGFMEPETEDPIIRYAAYLQGVALIERLGYEALEEATGHRGGEVYATGGGSRSDVWMQLRADVTGRVLHRPKMPESAMGAAILAAAGTVYNDVWEAAGSMVSHTATFKPNPANRAAYDGLYDAFLDQLRQRGYLAESEVTHE